MTLLPLPSSFLHSFNAILTQSIILSPSIESLFPLLVVLNFQELLILSFNDSNPSRFFSCYCSKWMGSIRKGTTGYGCTTILSAILVLGIMLDF